MAGAQWVAVDVVRFKILSGFPGGVRQGSRILAMGRVVLLWSLFGWCDPTSALAMCIISSTFAVTT